jgi:hypothetical protein
MHPAIHQELLPVCGEMIAGSRDFSRRAEKGDLHEEASQSFRQSMKNMHRMDNVLFI